MFNSSRKIRGPRMFNGIRVKSAAEYNAEWGPTSTNYKKKQEELERKEKEEKELIHIIIPYENDSQKFVKISVKKVDNPENLQLNTLCSDYPILSDFSDVEKMVLVKVTVINHEM